MRPHKLTMKAFGPFAKETTVDFDAMGSSVYLISGDTGAGKTTIFDGIIYALYGTASGGARSGLGTEAFHSDYAKEGLRREELRVEFSFSNAGRNFTVSRRMYWGKRGESKTVAKESTLAEDGTIIVWGKGLESRDDVTERVTELLGLDADQFRRIIMLAQGEFQKFLTAKSDERGVILGKLYDNRRHQDLQFRLKAAAALLKQKDSAAVGEAKAQLNLLVIPAGIGEERRAALSVDHPALMTALRELIAELEKELDEAVRSVGEQEKKQKQLEEERTRGITENRLLDELREKKKDRLALDERKEKIDALKTALGRAEAAEKVVPFEDAARQADRELSAARNELAKLTERGRQLERQLADSERKAKETEETETPRIAELDRESARIRSILPEYDGLAESRKKQAAKKLALKEAENGRALAEKTLERRRARQEELEAELKRLEGAGDSAVSLAARRLEDCSRRGKELKEAQSRAEALLSLEEEEKERKKALAAALQTELEAEETHHGLYRTFIQGQAALLAQDMREALKEKAETVCPVCGAVRTGADAHCFAEWDGETPTAEAVDAAKEEWEEARRKKEAAREAHAAVETELSAGKRTLLDRTEQLISVSDWAVLKEGSALSDAAETCEKERKAADRAHRQALADRDAKAEAAAGKTEADRQTAEAENALKKAESGCAEAGTEAAAAAADTESRERQLQGYPENGKAAKERIASLENEADSLRKRIEGAREAHAACEREQAENAGKLEAARSGLAAREQAQKSAAERYDGQRTRQGFADEAAYRAALSPDGTALDREALSDWIRDAGERIGAYAQAILELDAAVEQLSESTKDMKYADIPALEEQIDGVSVRLKELRASEKELSAGVGTDRAVCGRLEAILERRDGYRRVHERLVPLAETANGGISFSRYVLTGFFEQIVGQANLHLETMTDGEYQLIPRESGDGRSSGGLGLKVLNTITNQERDTASLSGGQLFEASLSLALGLSDVVQMESTGSIRIDSMFIDEGFGSLDGGRLDKAVGVLQRLSAGKRQIGIISHVARLDECLPKKIHVVAGERGSTIRIETDE